MSDTTEKTASTPAAKAASGLSTLGSIAVATLGVQAMTLLTGIISARVLGVQGRGELALAVAASALFARLTMAGALPVSVSTLLAREGLTARDGLRPFVARWSWQALVPSIAAGAYVGYLLRGESAYLYLGLGLAAAAITYQTIATGIIGAAIQGELAPIRTVAIGAIVLVAPFPIALSLIVAFVSVDDAVVVAAILVASGFVGWALNLRLLRAAEGRTSTITAGELRRTSRANYVAAIGTLNGLGIDRNLVGAWLGTAALGLYAVAVAFGSLSSIVGNGVASLLLPRLTAADPADRRRLIRTWSLGTGAFIALLVIGIQVVLHPVITLAFGKEFEGAVEIARWLVLADGLMGMRRLPICVLQARGRAGLASLIETVATIALVAGIAGAALAERLVLVAVAMAGSGLLSLVLLTAAAAIAKPAVRGRHIAGRP